MNTKRFLRIGEVCEITGLSKGGIYKQIREDRFPKPIKITDRSSGWADDAIDEWIQSKAPSASERSGDNWTKQSSGKGEPK